MVPGKLLTKARRPIPGRVRTLLVGRWMDFVSGCATDAMVRRTRDKRTLGIDRAVMTGYMLPRALGTAVEWEASSGCLRVRKGKSKASFARGQPRAAVLTSVCFTNSSGA